MPLASEGKQLVVQETLMIILRELSYLPCFTPITDMEASAEGAQMVTSWLCPLMSLSLLHGSGDTSGLHSIFSTSTTPFDGGISLLEFGDVFSSDDKLLVLSLN